MRATRLALLLASSLLICGFSLAAQQPAQPAPLTELEALRVENSRLESLVLQVQLDAFHAKRAKLTRDLEAARPGWVWNIETATFTAKIAPQ